MAKSKGSQPRTKLAQVRRSRRLSQVHVAAVSGVSLPTIQRLERGAVRNPGIRTLTNLARVYGCELVDICEPEWLRWTVFDVKAAKPPRKGS